MSSCKSRDIPLSDEKKAALRRWRTNMESAEPLDPEYKAFLKKESDEIDELLSSLSIKPGAAHPVNNTQTN